MKHEILKGIADNPPLFEALKELLRSKFSLEGVGKDLPNEQLGEVVRARLEGLARVEEVFVEIARQKSQPPRESAKNLAR